jgi:hypothetical protein
VVVLLYFYGNCKIILGTGVCISNAVYLKMAGMSCGRGVIRSFPAVLRIFLTSTIPKVISTKILSGHSYCTELALVHSTYSKQMIGRKSM